MIKDTFSDRLALLAKLLEDMAAYETVYKESQEWIRKKSEEVDALDEIGSSDGRQQYLDKIVVESYIGFYCFVKLYYFHFSFRVLCSFKYKMGLNFIVVFHLLRYSNQKWISLTRP